MGSVGEDYRCPWCGREGAGGYAPDGIDYPICTEGQYSCLWHALPLALSLQRAVAPKHQVFRELRLAAKISSFLVK